MERGWQIILPDMFDFRVVLVFLLSIMTSLGTIYVSSYISDWVLILWVFTASVFFSLIRLLVVIVNSELYIGVRQLAWALQSYVVPFDKYAWPQINLLLLELNIEKYSSYRGKYLLFAKKSDAVLMKLYLV